MKILLVSLLTLFLFQGVFAEFEEPVRRSDARVFSDIDSRSLEGQAAMYLKSKGIIGGRPDGRFDGGAPVNRAELAKFLLLAKQVEVGNLKNNQRFPDLLEGEWYVKYVMRANQLGMLSGYPDRRFRPARTVNTAEFLKMLTEAFNLGKNLPHNYQNTDSNEWFSPYIGVAQKYDLFPKRSQLTLEPSRLMTRNEVAIAISRVLNTSNNVVSTASDSIELQLQKEQLEIEKQRLLLEQQRLYIEKDKVAEELLEKAKTENLISTFLQCDAPKLFNRVWGKDRGYIGEVIFCELTAKFDHPYIEYSIQVVPEYVGIGSSKLPVFLEYIPHLAGINGQVVSVPIYIRANPGVGKRVLTLKLWKGKGVKTLEPEVIELEVLY